MSCTKNSSIFTLTEIYQGLSQLSPASGKRSPPSKMLAAPTSGPSEQVHYMTQVSLELLAQRYEAAAQA